MDTSVAVVSKEQAPAQSGFMGMMLQLPGVETAVQQSQSVYGKIKGSNPVVSSTFMKAERLANMVIPSPKSSTQDDEKSSESAKPASENASTAATGASGNGGVHTMKEYGKSKVVSLKELSWRKTNEVLSSRYGMKALQGIDYASGLLEGVLNRYLPLAEGDSLVDVRITPAEEDGLAHAVQTVGRVGKQLVLRVQNKVKTEKDGIARYLTSFSAYEVLADYVNKICKRKAVPEQVDEPKQK